MLWRYTPAAGDNRHPAIPLMAMSWAVVPVCAANYGARRYDRVKIAYFYALKLMIVTMLLIMAVTYIFAPQICILLSYSESTIGLRDGMVDMLRIMVLSLPFLALGSQLRILPIPGMAKKSLISA